MMVKIILKIIEFDIINIQLNILISLFDNIRILIS